MTEREKMLYVVENNGGCDGLYCDECPIDYLNGCMTNQECRKLAEQWLTDHPETPDKPTPDPRRYEIAKAVMAGFAASCNESCYMKPEVAAKEAVEWTDALIAELDKEAAKP